MTSTLVLKTGDLVDVVAPSSAAPMDVVAAGVKVLESWGLRVRLPADLIEANTFFANSDKKRLMHLKKALLSKDSKAVWCVRGGSGMHRLLPELFKAKAPASKKKTKGKLEKTTKLLIGFSDITSLHAGLYKHWGWKSIHGPVLGQLGRAENGTGDLNKQDIETLRQYLFGEINELILPGLEQINAVKAPKKISGTLLGGNLIVFETLIGTKDLPKTKGSILFFEEVNERGYRLDRIFVHLRQAGIFDGVKAVVFGDFIGGDEPGTSGVNRVHWAFENLAKDLKIPLFKGLPVGHGARNMPLLVGAPAEIVGKELRCGRRS